jgi:hypothetical protein
MQPPAHKKRSLDALSSFLLIFALICLAVSVPATYGVAALTHSSALGAALVVLIFEGMAFGAKILTRFYLLWDKPLDWLARGLLTAAVLPNFVEGWSALYRATEVASAWAAVRDFSLWGVPAGAALLVGVWAALPPFGVYLSLSGWVKRHRELELEQTPTSAVERRLAPITAELAFQQELDRKMEALVEQRRAFAAKLLSQLPAPAVPFGPVDAAPPSVLTLPREAESFPAPVEVIPNEVCADCGVALNPGAKGAAIKQARKAGADGKLRCASCRNRNV